MSREELELLKADELAYMCRIRQIAHYNGKTRFKKADMVDAILKALKEEEPPIAQGRDKIETVEEANVGVAKEEKGATYIQSSGALTTEAYIMNAKVGTLVAFKDAVGKPNTAAIQNISYRRRQLRLVTQYGKEYIVPFESVMWVRTTRRWPRFVLKMLKEKCDGDCK